MNKQEWELSTKKLRTLLGLLETQGATAGREIKYKFAIDFNPMFGFYHLWNGVSKNTVCTVRITSKKVIVRYRPNSHYRYEIQKLKFGDKETVFVPSTNLSRHRSWMNRRVQDRVEQEIAKVRSFLDRQGSQSFTQEPYILTIHIPLSLDIAHFTGPPTQITTGSTLELHILFHSNEEMASNSDSARSIVERLIRIGAFSNDTRISWEELKRLYVRLVERDSMWEDYRNMPNPYGEIESVPGAIYDPQDGILRSTNANLTASNTSTSFISLTNRQVENYREYVNSIENIITNRANAPFSTVEEADD